MGAGQETMCNLRNGFSVITENSPTKAAQLHKEPVSVFLALGIDLQPLAAAGLEPATPGL